MMKIQKYLKIFTDLKFAILILIILAIASSLGSFIEQDESSLYYQENYTSSTISLLLNLGLDHVYTTWWFLSLLVILGLCLLSCTMTRQFPLFKNSKEYLFKKKRKSFLPLPFSVKIKTIYYLKEIILLKIQNLNFYLYQNGNLIYGYKGLLGRISPILVHFSLIIILTGAGIGAFKNFKAQEILPKGELFHIQNPIRVGWFTSLPTVTTRINDFWVEYENNRIHQFYSNLSILDNYGNEIKNQTISVNNPLRFDNIHYENIDYYQSDWNLLGIRLKDIQTNQIDEFPLFSLPKASKSWLTWINKENENKLLVFDQFQNTFLTYDQEGNFLNSNNIGDHITKNSLILDILPSTGLLIKYDPSIFIIYVGFGLLMITASLSYLPYTQIWLFTPKNQSFNNQMSKSVKENDIFINESFIGSITNRGKIQLEVDFENLIRTIENQLSTYH